MKKRLFIAAMVILCTSAQAQYSETNNLFYNTFRTPQSGQCRRPSESVKHPTWGVRRQR